MPTCTNEENKAQDEKGTDHAKRTKKCTTESGAQVSARIGHCKATSHLTNFKTKDVSERADFQEPRRF